MGFLNKVIYRFPNGTTVNMGAALMAAFLVGMLVFVVIPSL